MVIGVGFGRFRVHALAIQEPYRVVELANGVHARLALTRGGARACGALVRGALEIAPCVGAEIVSMRGGAVDITTPGQDHIEWGDATAGGELRWEFVRGMAATIDCIAEIPFYRRDLLVAPHGSVYTVPILSGRGTAGIDVRF